jgi:hypothetical protein
MSDIPNDDMPGFVAEKPEYCYAYYRLIHPGQIYRLTIGFEVLCADCALSEGRDLGERRSSRRRQARPGAEGVFESARELPGLPFQPAPHLPAIPAHELSRGQNVTFHGLVKLCSASPRIEVEDGVQGVEPEGVAVWASLWGTRASVAQTPPTVRAVHAQSGHDRVGWYALW